MSLRRRAEEPLRVHQDISGNNIGRAREVQCERPCVRARAVAGAIHAQGPLRRDAILLPAPLERSASGRGDALRLHVRAPGGREGRVRVRGGRERCEGSPRREQQRLRDAEAVRRRRPHADIVRPALRRPGDERRRGVALCCQDDRKPCPGRVHVLEDLARHNARQVGPRAGRRIRRRMPGEADTYPVPHSRRGDA